LNSVQTWVTKTHGTYPDLFSGNHLLTVQKPVSEWYVIEQFIGSIAEWSEHYALLWCSRKATHREEQDRVFALVNQRRSSNLGFWILHAKN